MSSSSSSSGDRTRNWSKRLLMGGVGLLILLGLALPKIRGGGEEQNEKQGGTAPMAVTVTVLRPTTTSE